MKSILVTRWGFGVGKKIISSNILVILNLQRQRKKDKQKNWQLRRKLHNCFVQGHKAKLAGVGARLAPEPLSLTSSSCSLPRDDLSFLFHEQLMSLEQWSFLHQNSVSTPQPFVELVCVSQEAVSNADSNTQPMKTRI